MWLVLIDYNPYILVIGIFASNWDYQSLTTVPHLIRQVLTFFVAVINARGGIKNLDSITTRTYALKA